MLARVGSVSYENIHMTGVGLIENVAGEWRMGQGSIERRIEVD